MDQSTSKPKVFAVSDIVYVEKSDYQLYIVVVPLSGRTVIAAAIAESEEAVKEQLQENGFDNKPHVIMPMAEIMYSLVAKAETGVLNPQQGEIM